MKTAEEADATSGIDGKAEIVFFDGDLPATVGEIERVLVERDPAIVQRGGVLYVNLADGAVRATAALLRFRAMRVANFYRVVFRPDFQQKPADPPLKYFEALRSKGEWSFPTLDHGGAGTIG